MGTRLRVSIGVSLAVVLLMACSSASAPGQAPESTPAPRLILTPPSFERVTPVPVPSSSSLVFRSSQDWYSPLLSVSGTRWQILWSVRSSLPEHLLFVIAVFPRGSTSEAVAATESRAEGSGTLEIPKGPGEYYIRVFAANVQSWRLEIRQ